MVLSMERWRGKVAVVTGASSGIGAAIAERLVEHGVKVVGLARRVELIEQNAKKLSDKTGKLHALKVDLTNSDEIIEAFKMIGEKFGPIHILINNAGLVSRGTLCEGDIVKWKTVFDLNVLALAITTKEAIANMKKHNVDGLIIQMNSVAGQTPVRIPEMNVYPASKYAVTALTESFRQELVTAGSKIRVTSISPGMVKTEIIEKSGWDLLPSDLPPLLNTSDIADAAIYVLSTPPHVQVNELTLRPTSSVD